VTAAMMTCKPTEGKAGTAISNIIIIIIIIIIIFPLFYCRLDVTQSITGPSGLNI